MKSSIRKFIFGPVNLTHVVIAFAVMMAILALILYYASGQNFDPLSDLFSDDEDSDGAFGLILLALFIGHAVFLFALDDLSTREARAPVQVIFSLVMTGAIFTLLEAVFTGSSEGGFGPAIYFVVLINTWISFRGFLAFSISSSLLGLIPLTIFYALPGGLFATLGMGGLGGMSSMGVIALFLLPGLWFPLHRRIAKEWRPKRLPRLSKVRRAGRTRAGLTLIELLIVVAIIAIFVPAVARLSGQAHMTLERQSTRRASLEYVRDEVALLRARETLPEPGVHAPSAELMEEYPFMAKSEFEIRTGPVEGVAEVEFRIRLIYEFDDIERSYFVLIGDPAL